MMIQQPRVRTKIYGDKRFDKHDVISEQTNVLYASSVVNDRLRPILRI
jgi:hypothetical protein